MGTISNRALLFILLMFVSASFIPAQTLNMQSIPSEKIQFGLNYCKPFFKDNYGISISSNVIQLNLNIPLGKDFNIIANMPYIITNFNFNSIYYISENYNKEGIGNLFVGAQTNTDSNPEIKSIVTFGIFLPTADENAGFYGFYANYYDLQKYMPNSLGFYFNYAYHRIPDKGFVYGLEAGPDLIIPTKSDGSNSELLLHYGITGGYQVNDLLINAEFLGLMVVSEHYQNFSDRFANMLDFGVQWKRYFIMPKLFYQVFLRKEMSDYVNGVLGIGVTVAIDR